MKNNTKIRLKLSKQLFESLAKQVLAEGKKGDMSGGAYTEAVKTPKSEKSTEPKEPKSNNEASVGSTPKPKQSAPSKPGTSDIPGANTSGIKSVVDLRNMMLNIYRELPKMQNVQGTEAMELGELIKSVIDKIDDGNIGPALDKADRAFDIATKNIVNKKVSEMQTNIDEDDTMDFQKGAFNVSEMGKMKGKKDMKEALGRQVAAEDLMGAISSGDPLLVGAALVGLVVAGVFSADKISKTVKGYWQGLTQNDPAKAEELKQKAEEVGIDVER
jgi:hypothetical protein